MIRTRMQEIFFFLKSPSKGNTNFGIRLFYCEGLTIISPLKEGIGVVFLDCRRKTHHFDPQYTFLG